MSSAKRLMHDNDRHFESLKPSTQNIIRDAILNAAMDRNGPEGWKQDDECLGDIECRSRDGFIASGYNLGGLTYRNFVSPMDYRGSGHTVSHEGAAKEIERQITYNLNCVAEQIAFEIGDDFEYYFKSDLSKLTYSSLIELAQNLEKQDQIESSKKVNGWADRIQDLECEFLSGEDSSIMHELRVMYHGEEGGLHSASISAALNTEGPYHRSSISWAPDVFCEGAKEVEITWKNNAELKRKLAKALAKVSKAIF